MQGADSLGCELHGAAGFWETPSLPPCQLPVTLALLLSVPTRPRHAAVRAVHGLERFWVSSKADKQLCVRAPAADHAYLAAQRLPHMLAWQPPPRLNTCYILLRTPRRVRP